MVEAQDKQHAHALIERLAPGQVAAVVGLLEMILDPFARTLANAPWDDEPVTEHEAQGIAEASASIARGEGVSHDEVLAEFGLSIADFDRLGDTPIPPSSTGG